MPTSLQSTQRPIFKYHALSPLKTHMSIFVVWDLKSVKKVVFSDPPLIRPNFFTLFRFEKTCFFHLFFIFFHLLSSFIFSLSYSTKLLSLDSTHERSWFFHHFFDQKMVKKSTSKGIMLIWSIFDLFPDNSTKRGSK